MPEIFTSMSLWSQISIMVSICLVLSCCGYLVWELCKALTAEDPWFDEGPQCYECEKPVSELNGVDICGECSENIK